MNKSGYVEGTSIPDFDEKIEAFLKRKKIAVDEGNMVTAIQNADKKVYRIIHTDGMNTYMDLMFFLSNLGLEDRLENSYQPRNGFDSFYVVPNDSKLS
tara:strand:- start:518 stop:811 length:294 start_codon:yes stop_codon:yes gene_type:complete